MWGTIPLLIRRVDPVPVQLPGISAAYDAAPVLIVFWRVVVATALMAGFIAFRRGLTAAFSLEKRTLSGLALNGALLSLHWFLFFSALTMTEVAVAELLTFTGPVYVAALTPVVLKERFDQRVLLPIAVSLAGMALVLGPGSIRLDEPRSLAGAGMALAAAIVFAFLMLNAKRLLRDVPSSIVVFWEALVAALLLLPLVLALPGFADTDGWIAGITLGLVHSGLVAFAFLTALRHVRADHAAVLMYVEPVAAVFLAAAFLGEPLTLSTVVGGAAVVTGGVMVARLAQTPSAEVPVASSGIQG